MKLRIFRSAYYSNDDMNCYLSGNAFDYQPVPCASIDSYGGDHVVTNRKDTSKWWSVYLFREYAWLFVLVDGLAKCGNPDSTRFAVMLWHHVLMKVRVALWDVYEHTLWTDAFGVLKTLWRKKFNFTNLRKRILNARQFFPQRALFRRAHQCAMRSSTQSCLTTWPLHGQMRPTRTCYRCVRH